MTDTDQSKTAERAALPRARARYLQQSIQLEEDEPSWIGRMSVYMIVAFVIASVGWAGITRVNEVVSAPGEVIAGGLVHTVEHLEGGIVQEILVRDGDIVAEGDVLLNLLPSASEADLDQLHTRRGAITIRVARVQAMMTGEKPDFGSLAETLPTVATKEIEAYEAMIEEYEAELSALERRIERQEDELSRQQNMAAALSNEVAIAEEQFDMRVALADQQLGSRADTLNMQARVASLKSEHQEAVDSVSVMESSIAETRQQLAEATSRWRSELAQDAVQAAAELAELENSLVKHQDRVHRLAVRAPVAGIVEGMTVDSINAVIQPGEEILQIVPIDQELIVESRVSAEEVGHIRPGLETDVKVHSYDSTRFGTVGGVVRRLSATSFSDGQNPPYFLAEISLSASYLGSNSSQLRVIPGMTVTADIQIGKKSVLEYLMKPVSRGFDNSFREI